MESGGYAYKKAITRLERMLAGFAYAPEFLDFFEGAALGFGHLVVGEDPGGNGEGSVEPKRARGAHHLQQGQKRQRTSRFEPQLKAAARPSPELRIFSG